MFTNGYEVSFRCWVLLRDNGENNQQVKIHLETFLSRQEAREAASERNEYLRKDIPQWVVRRVDTSMVITGR